MDRALVLGINFFDTRDVDGLEKYHGYADPRSTCDAADRRDRLLPDAPHRPRVPLVRGPGDLRHASGTVVPTVSSPWLRSIRNV